MAKYDSHRLFQVLSNLIHNAIKFTPEGGAIRLRAARVGGSCQVSVSDTGVGIPEGDSTSIFERFRQLDRGIERGWAWALYRSLDCQKRMAGESGPRARSAPAPRSISPCPKNDLVADGRCAADLAEIGEFSALIALEDSVGQPAGR